MTTLAWFHCFAGIAGDMALGSLIDAGADAEEVRTLLKRLPVTGWRLDAIPVLRGGIAATKAQVVMAGVPDTPNTPIALASEGHAETVRTYANIRALLDQAHLPDRIRDRAGRAFAALAEAEGKLHRRPAAEVQFHEVGGLDAIVDVVGTCAALEVLEVDEVWASPVATGTGLVHSAHGVLPNPAPAVVELLRGAPTYGRALSLELTTPTGAALLAALVMGYGPLPAMTIGASGFGAGSRDLENLPNVTQVVVGSTDPTGSPGGGVGRDPGQPVVLLEANVDDATGETLAYAVAMLLEVGAHDAWVTPILMKKGRPGYTVSALADPAAAEIVGRRLTAETGSLGLRGQTLQRWPAARTLDQVEVEGLPVRVKVSAGRVKVEYNDAAQVARARSLPLREVLTLAEAAWRRRLEHGQY
jgi:uncharacterized protein (TIGR00299 family) protein